MPLNILSDYHISYIIHNYYKTLLNNKLNHSNISLIQYCIIEKSLYYIKQYRELHREES